MALQDALSMRFSRQEYWSGLPFSTPGHLPGSGIEPASPVSPALASGFFTTCVTWKIYWPGERQSTKLSSQPPGQWHSERQSSLTTSTLNLAESSLQTEHRFCKLGREVWGEGTSSVHSLVPDSLVPRLLGFHIGCWFSVYPTFQMTVP